jgi:tetratricopeptide (TPR) repeat protein
MSALGVTNILEADAAFSRDVVKPAAPGRSRRVSEVSTSRRPFQEVTERIAEAIDFASSQTLLEARLAVEAVRGPHNLVALAQALEIAQEDDEAVEAALEALDVYSSDRLAADLDRTGVRLACELLLRKGRLEEVREITKTIPLSNHLKVDLAVALADADHFVEARRFILSSEASSKNAALGYIHLLEGENHKAISRLRDALRNSPDDAVSALNLSIALWRSGSRRKAVSAARHAREADPSREDALCLLLDLLFAQADFDSVQREMRKLDAQYRDSSPQMLIMQARLCLEGADLRSAIRLLEKAAKYSEQANDRETEAEVRSNLIRIRAAYSRESRADSVRELLDLSFKFPESDVVVSNLAQVSWRTSDAAALSSAFDRVEDTTFPARAAFIRYTLATLRGESSEAATFAREWYQIEPFNPRAVTAALVALGIGEERWEEAAAIALDALSSGVLHNGVSKNNAAYVLAMSGRSRQAIDLIRNHADESYELKATLGLAHLAAGDVEVGMKLYRAAADAADKDGDDARSLMTMYQALIVRQLGALDVHDKLTVTALSLPPFPLPDDWEDRPEFVRLHRVALRRGYGWPLSI